MTWSKDDGDLVKALSGQRSQLRDVEEKGIRT